MREDRRFHLEALRHGHNNLIVIRNIVTKRIRDLGQNDEVFSKALEVVYARLAEALDDHKHAPMCPANHYHGANTNVRYHCTCGAWKHGVVMENRPAIGIEEKG